MITFQPSDLICDLVSILFKACKNTPQVMFLFFFHNKLLKVLFLRDHWTDLGICGINWMD